ncbi:MAG: T9SS type A sorting domain-containing protein, partial [Bacteroidota bacterium]
WLITGLNSGDGIYSAQSGDIDDSEESVLSILINVTRKDSLAFKYKVDCEPVWDVFEVKADSILRFTASGTIDWSSISFMLDTGIHQIDFIYKKDNVFSAGLDAALIDDVRFPPFTSIVSVEEMDNLHNSFIYPNPASDYVFVKGYSSKGIKTVYIYDVNGRCLYRSSNDIQNKYPLRIPVTGYNEGIYFIVMETASEVITSKLIIKH